MAALALGLSLGAGAQAAEPLGMGAASDPLAPVLLQPTAQAQAMERLQAAPTPTPLSAAPAPTALATAVPTLAPTAASTAIPTLAPTLEATAVVTPAPASTSPAVSLNESPSEALAWDKNKLFYSAGLSALSLSNGDPLAYRPIELGYQFGYGLRLSGGMEVFFYEGLDDDIKNSGLGVQRYSYQMTDLRLAAAYLAPVTRTLRPLIGLSVDFVSGERAVARLINAPRQSAYSYIGLGAVLGGEWMYSDGYSLSLLARGIFSFTERGVSTGLGLGWQVYF